MEHAHLRVFTTSAMGGGIVAGVWGDTSSAPTTPPTGSAIWRGLMIGATSDDTRDLLTGDAAVTYDFTDMTVDVSIKRHGVDIFTANQVGQDFSRATLKLRNHIYDYTIVDSAVERSFAQEMDSSSQVIVYAKLPRGFLIPTPVGDYNPDWAISFRAGSVRHIYFVAETKGSMSSMKLRQIENAKIECARKFFDRSGENVTEDRVKYDVVTDFGKLMDIVGRPM